MPPIGNKLNYPISEIAKEADSKKRYLSMRTTASMLDIIQKRRRERGWRGAFSNVLAKSKVVYYPAEELSDGDQMSAWLESTKPTSEALLYTQVVTRNGDSEPIPVDEPRLRAAAYNDRDKPPFAMDFFGVNATALTPQGRLQLVADMTETVNLIFRAEGMPEIDLLTDRAA